MSFPPTGPLIFFMGPTASGKSELALALAERFSLDIVNADSVQVYQGLDIGSAKASAQERRRVVHHLLDLVTPNETFSADRYRQLAWQVIRECHGRGVVPLFVGGSGLYFRAVEQGLVQTPTVDVTIRQEIYAEGLKIGWPSLHQRLHEVDPQLAARLSTQDGQRIGHGLAVFVATGKSLSHWQQCQPPSPDLDMLKLALEWPRELLFQRINQRFEHMLAQGLLAEAAQLLKEGYNRDHPAMKAVGYRQIFAYLDEKCSLAEAMEQSQRASRRYAKRQMTWLRQEKGLNWIPWNESATAFSLVAQFLAEHGHKIKKV